MQSNAKERKTQTRRIQRAYKAQTSQAFLNFLNKARINLEKHDLQCHKTPVSVSKKRK